MIFNGFQKLTLLDYPGHTACTLFTNGCNLRCPFCHNAVLVDETYIPKGEFLESYDSDEILAFLKRRIGLLDGVAITGGEPLLASGLFIFIEQARALGYKIKLDTNGTLPDRLEVALRSGLVDYVAIDVKNSPSLYAETCGLPFDANEKLITSLSRSLALLEEYKQNGKIDYELRTTVSSPRHNAANISSIADFILEATNSPRVNYFIQVYKDSGNILVPNAQGTPTKEDLQTMLEAAKKKLPNTIIRN